MVTNLKPIAESGGSLRRQPKPGKVCGVPQISQSSGYSSRSMRPLAPRAQYAGVKAPGVKTTITRRGSQTTDLSKLEAITIQQLSAVSMPPVVCMPPRLPVMPALLEQPPGGLPEFGYSPCWVNNSYNVNVLPNAATGNM